MPGKQGLFDGRAEAFGPARFLQFTMTYDVFQQFLCHNSANPSRAAEVAKKVPIRQSGFLRFALRASVDRTGTRQAASVRVPPVPGPQIAIGPACHAIS
jgi:hypothetical protein